MHIKNSKPGRPHPSAFAQDDAKHHRHFLALPVLLCLLTTVFGSTRFPVQAAVVNGVSAGTISAAGADRAFSLPRGASGLLREDGILDDTGVELSLTAGTVLVASEGMARLRIGNVVTSAFHGGYLATRNGTKFSLHALTSPVLLARDGFRLVIPAGMQGSWRDETALPSTFSLQNVAEQSQELRIIPESVARDEHDDLRALAPVPLPPFGSEPALPPVLAPFALPAAQERIAQQEARAQLLRLRGALASGDRDAVHALLRESGVQEILSSLNLPSDVLPVLLADAAALPSSAEELIQYVQNTDLWMLLSFHPQYRSAAWESSGPLSVTRDARLVRWLQLPSSDVGEAVSGRVVDQWEQQVKKYVGNEPQDADFPEALLECLRNYRSFLEENEFPERLRRYADALQGIIGPSAPLLSDGTKLLYTQWEDVDAIAPYVDAAPIVAQPVTVTPAAVPEAAPAPFNAAALEAQTKQMLLASGALFTTQTTLHAESASNVAVTALLFASEDAEHQYDFTVDPVSGQLSNIQRDGESLPYALTLEAFAKWAAQ